MAPDQDLDAVRRLRPDVTAPDPDVVRSAKERLVSVIENHPAAVEPRSPRRSSTRRRLITGVVTGAVAAGLIGIVAVTDHRSPSGTTTVVSADGTPAMVLLAAATVSTEHAGQGEGTIRHLRFVNLTDEGHPTYESWIRPDGSALVGSPGHYEESSGYLTQAQLDSLPSDPETLRARMLQLATQLGLGFPGEAPERGLYRLASTLLPDPGVTSSVKAGVYRVLAAMDLTAIKARNLGVGTDPDGREGVVLELRFEEDAVDRLVIDRATGALLSTETRLADGKDLGGQVYLQSDLADAAPSS